MGPLSEVAAVEVMAGAGAVPTTPITAAGAAALTTAEQISRIAPAFRKATEKSLSPSEEILSILKLLSVSLSLIRPEAELHRSFQVEGWPQYEKTK